jgi:hypothetical protein
MLIHPSDPWPSPGHPEAMKIIRQGSATPTDDVESRLLIHVTLNDQGEVTAEVFKAEGECT